MTMTPAQFGFMLGYYGPGFIISLIFLLWAIKRRRFVLGTVGFVMGATLNLAYGLGIAILIFIVFSTILLLLKNKNKKYIINQ